MLCYFQHLPRITAYPTAHYDVDSLFELVQADLAFIKLRFNKQIGFLLLIDVFSRRIFCKMIADKFAKTILKKIEEIIEETGNMDISVLQTDR
jgi:hypothetical protein